MNDTTESMRADLVYARAEISDLKTRVQELESTLAEVLGFLKVLPKDIFGIVYDGYGEFASCWYALDELVSNVESVLGNEE